MNFVLDCSVTMAWLLEDQADSYTDSVLDSLQKRSALTPVLWSYEVANVLVTAEKKRIVSHSQAARFLELLRNLNISIQALHDLKHDEMLVDVGRAYSLTAYDGAYLKLALNRGLPLATRDAALRQACTKAGVALYRP
jgi:predicted nucleic acid-binding protein